MQKKAQQDGLKMFMMSIPSYAIKQEIYYNVKTCFRCYALEDHNTNQCDKSQEYKICSECAEYGHIWKDCSKNIFKCINCSGDHRTLASKCPRRKEIIKNKRHSDQVPKQTYSQAAQQQTSPSFTSPQNIPNNNETYTKIYTCIMHAHLQNIAEPGTYEEELNNMLKRNNLPEIKAPSNPPSGKILANLSVPTNNNYTTPDEEKTQQQIDEITTQDMQDHHCSHTTASSQEPTPAASAKAPTPIISRIKARHIGLKIYTTHSKGWPKKTLHKGELIDAIENSKYKMTFNTQHMEFNTILEHIKNDTIELEECWVITEDDVFRKIRPGREIQRTPPPTRVKQRKQSV